MSTPSPQLTLTLTLTLTLAITLTLTPARILARYTLFLARFLDRLLARDGSEKLTVLIDCRPRAGAPFAHPRKP